MVAPDSQSLLYTPPANFSGTDTFTYTMTDGVPNSEATASVTVTVTAVNDAPVATAQTLQVNSNTDTALTLTGTDGDPEVAQVLSYTVDTLPAVGVVSLSAGAAAITAAQLPLNLSTPDLFYRAPRVGTGPVTLTFHVQDDGGTANGGIDTSNPASVTVTVLPYSPTALTVTDIPTDDGTALGLSWTPSTNEIVVEQRVYRGLVSGGAYALVAIIPSIATDTFVDIVGDDS